MAGPNEENAESLEENNRHLNRNNAIYTRLNNALDAFGRVMGTAIQGAPQSISELTTQILGGDSKLQKSMEFAEAYIPIWRNLSRSGVNFNNDLEDMITKVGQANMRLDDFARMVDENGAVFASIGGIANTGAQSFLAAQASFFSREADNTFNPLRVELERLGLSTTQINESFLAFDQISAIRQTRQRMTEVERNQRAFEFTKNLDRLSRLTGKQADQLAEQQAEIARQGNVFAFSQQIDKDVRDELDAGLGALNEVSPIIKDYAIDMITRGFPNPNDPEMVALNNLAPRLRDTLYEARQAFLAGDEQRAKDLMRAAEAEAANQINNGRLMRLATLGSATELTRATQNIVTDLANSAIALSDQVVQEKARQMFGDVEFSPDQLARARDQLIQEQRDSQLAGETRAQRMLDTYLTGLRNVQAQAMQLQTQLVTGIFSVLYGASLEFTEFVGGLADAIGIEDLNFGNVSAEFRDLAQEALNLTRGMAEGAEVVREAYSTQRELETISQVLASAGTAPQDLAKINELISDLSVARQNAIESQEAGDIARVQALSEAAQRVIRNSGIIGPDREVNPELAAELINALSREDLNVGTMGRFGSLFQDFGRETPVNLHGLEAVVTPDQMANIVQSSALGALQSVAQTLGDGTFNNNTNMLNGMLNTIRNIPAEMATAMPESGTADLETSMARFASQMRVPLEEAMNNTLVPRIEQLVQVNSRNADTSDKIRKGIGNIGSDMLRST